MVRVRERHAPAVNDLESLLEGSSLLAALVEGSEDAIMAGSLDGTIAVWNPGAERLYGYSAEEMIGNSIALVRPERSLDEVRSVQAALERGERVPTFETREQRKDGALIDVAVSLSPVRDASGGVVGVSSIVRDISARKRAERALEQASRRFSSAFHGAPIGMALVGLDGSWLAVNAALCKLLRRSEDELLATCFQQVTHPDDLEANLAELRRTLAGEIDGYQVEKRYLRPDGEPVWARLSVSLVRDAQGRPVHFVSQLEDIGQAKRAEAKLRSYTEHLKELALRDPLTGLRNYRDYHATLDAELARARRHGGSFSVVLLHAKGVAAVNEREGRPRGDRVLAQVGSAIERACRASDRAARIGSDEFALVLAETDAAGAARTARRVAASVAARTDEVQVCWATSTWPEDGQAKQEMLRHADLRLRAARGNPGAAPGGTGPEPDPRLGSGVRRILALARSQLGMDVAYVAENTGGEQRFVAIEGDPAQFGVSEGSVLPLADTYCARMLAGRIPHAVPDTGTEPELATLAITTDAGVGAYLGVPLELPDGRPYGTLCCVSRAPSPALGHREVELAEFLAMLIADQIDRDERDAGARRQDMELTGIHALLAALDARDHYTGEHSQQVVRLARAVGGRLGLDAEQLLEVEQVALLHDIGKVGVPDAVLQKGGPLNAQEWDLMREHPAIGARILAGTRTLSHLAAAVRAEHERYDGRGYPDGLAGERIPLPSRITLACDSYHAMTSDRPYHTALSPERARAELRTGAETQFDPDVVRALLDVLVAAEAALTVADPRPLGTLGEPRLVCRRCGEHRQPLPDGAALDAVCPNCGSRELDPPTAS